MESIPVSKFKATCLARLERVRQTGHPLIITKRGVPIAQVIGPPPPESPNTGFGVMAGTVVEHGDILAPIDESEWEALR
ncbi:MAG: type II toxin-antitoxin system Phd/YefM family antitoxin [Chloroflexi bacterium]|nr:type II toxin-antitoxin system Phd/YefM family antitoxin [Chloroflexota bacterium]